MDFQETAKSVRDKYGYLNLLVNASGILTVPNVMQPGRDVVSFVFGFRQIKVDSDDF